MRHKNGLFDRDDAPRGGSLPHPPPHRSRPYLPLHLQWGLSLYKSLCKVGRPYPSPLTPLTPLLCRGVPFVQHVICATGSGWRPCYSPYCLWAHLALLLLAEGVVLDAGEVLHQVGHPPRADFPPRPQVGPHCLGRSRKGGDPRGLLTSVSSLVMSLSSQTFSG